MKNMPTILIITILISIALLFLALIEAIPNPILGIIVGLVLFIGSIIGSIFNKITGEESEINDKTYSLFTNQIKFYDTLFKGITVLLIIAAILLYKDRQDMINSYEKFMSEAQSKADSLISDAGIELTQSIMYAESLMISLKNATRDADKAQDELNTIMKELNNELTKARQVSEEMANMLYTQKQEKAINLWTAQYRKCAIGTDELIPNDKLYNNTGTEIVLSDTKAAEMFNKALEINSENKEAIFNLGINQILRFSEEGFLKAAEIFDRYIKLDSGAIEVYVYAAQSLIQVKGHEKEAYKRLKKAIDLGFDNHSLIIAEFCEKDTIFWQLLPSGLNSK